MKKFALLLLCTLLISTNSWARTRWFRINPETVTTDGYAIAWGVRDVPVDFEAVEQSDESINEFLAKYDNMIVNYLVDISRDTILAEIPSTSFFGRLGNFQIGNNYSITLYDLPGVSGLQDNQTALVLTQNWKWDNSFTDAFIVENNATATTVVKHYDMKDDVKDELIGNLNVYQKKIIENKAINYKINNEGELEISGKIPKCESNCETVNIHADLDFTVTPDQFKVGLSKIIFETEKDFRNSSEEVSGQ